MADLPPISGDAYTETAATDLMSPHQEPSNVSTSPATRPVSRARSPEKIEEPKSPIDEPDSISRCLFCNENFETLHTSLDHMSQEHGLFLPQIEHLSDLETVIAYLRKIVNEYNECLYCGVTKQSTAGIQRHMRDKGHCMINLEREPELLEFWEFSDSDEHSSDDETVPEPPTQVEEETAVNRDLSQGEYTLPSGRTISSKSRAREARLLARRLASATTSKESPKQTITYNSVKSPGANPSTETSRSLIETQEGVQSHALAPRDAAGLIGVSDQRLRSLAALEKKTQRQQAVVQASTKWAGDKGGIHQRHYKVKMNLRDG